MSAYPGRGRHGRVLDALGTRIVTGLLPPGAAIDPADLEREFAVSRSVVREALRVLTAKGLVDARPRRGTYVLDPRQWVALDSDVLRWRFAGEPDSVFLDELFELRLIIEPQTARLSALRRTSEDLTALEEALAAMTAAGTRVEPHVAADAAFHGALLAAAHNSLVGHLAPVVEAGLRVRDAFVHAALASNPVAEHRAVFEAVRDRDPGAAEHAMRELVERSAADVEAARALNGGGDAGGSGSERAPEAERSRSR